MTLENQSEKNESKEHEIATQPRGLNSLLVPLTTCVAKLFLSGILMAGPTALVTGERDNDGIGAYLGLSSMADLGVLLWRVYVRDELGTGIEVKKYTNREREEILKGIPYGFIEKLALYDLPKRIYQKLRKS